MYKSEPLVLVIIIGGQFYADVIYLPDAFQFQVIGLNAILLHKTYTLLCFTSSEYILPFQPYHSIVVVGSNI